MKRLLIISVISIALIGCNSNDDVDNTNIGGITITNDADCCSAEEALAVYNFLQTVKPVDGLGLTIDNQYDIQVYSKTGSFHTGYNDIYFVATKKTTDNYIKFLDITNIKPLMLMTKMGMRHSTPIASEVTFFDSKVAAVKHGWISFIMPSGESGNWTLDFDVEVLKKNGRLEQAPITVDELPNGQQWVKSFKVNDQTYYLSLVNPSDWATGTNTVKAYISVKSSDAKEPYKLADEPFTIDIDPRMPDMGNHTSPDNEGLTRQIDDSYKGRINLTMTGLWRIHLTVSDAKGDVVAGGDNLNQGYSSLYWDVTL